MKEEVTRGSTDSINKHKPIFFVKVLKSNKNKIENDLRMLGYEIFPFGMNTLAVHKNAPVVQTISVSGNSINIS
jgi:hypothetical protein